MFQFLSPAVPSINEISWLKAAYGPGWAVMWQSTGGSERLAVELVSRLGDQRHRLVAVWRQVRKFVCANIRL